MFNNAIHLISLVAILMAVGCQEPTPGDNVDSSESTAATETTTESPSETATKKPHSHSDDDILVWVQSEIEDGEFTVSLGHHGVHFHGGDEIEPAVSISKGEEDVADAVVFNNLIAEDRETILAEERPTVFEPKTEDEPAHYAQGALVIPKNTKKFLIRFRIKFPGVDAESTYDIEQEVSD